MTLSHNAGLLTIAAAFLAVLLACVAGAIRSVTRMQRRNYLNGIVLLLGFAAFNLAVNGQEYFDPVLLQERMHPLQVRDSIMLLVFFGASLGWFLMEVVFLMQHRRRNLHEHR